MKNSGGGSGGDTDHVFDFVRRYAEVVSDVRDAVACYEAVDEILDSGATMNDQRQAECDMRIDNDLSMLVGR